METQAPFSPVIRKIAGEVVAKSKHRSFTRPTEICLENWWLSRAGGGKGLAVSGRPIENRKGDDAQRKFHSAPSRRTYASREFHSAKIRKRHGCTTLETFDGFIVSLCGFINKSRTQQNGFSSEVCRDFIFGFPLNWEDYAASVSEESERDAFCKKAYDNLIGMLSPQPSDGSEAQPPKSTSTSTPQRTKASKNRQRNAL